MLIKMRQFYLRERLLHPSSQTSGAYRLFDEVCALGLLWQIAHLNTTDGLTIGETRVRVQATEHHPASEVDHG